MLRLTFDRDDTTDDPVEWAAWLRDALPSGVQVVAAYLDAATLTIYVESAEPSGDTVRVLREALGLRECGVATVVPLVPRGPVETFSPPGPTAAPRALRPTNERAGRIMSVELSSDGRKVLARVRHAQYEHVDRLECIESKDAVTLVAWLESATDDPRADYVSLAHAFTDVAAELDAPVGARRIEYDLG